MKNLRHLRQVAAFVLLVILLAASSTTSAQSTPVWRTLEISNSTPHEGTTTDVYFSFGNRGHQAVRLEMVTCQTVGFNGHKTFLTDAIKAVSVTDETGASVGFETNELTSVRILLNVDLPPRREKDFVITMLAQTPNYIYGTGTEPIDTDNYSLSCVVSYDNGASSGDSIEIYVVPA